MNTDIDGLLRQALKVGCEEAEIFSSETDSFSCAAERGQLSDTRQTRETDNIGLRVIHGGKVGFAFGRLDKFNQILEEAIGSSSVGQPGFELPTPQSYSEPKGIFDPALLDSSGDFVERLAAVLDFIKQPDVKPTWAGVQIAHSKYWVANTRGLFVEDEGTSISWGVYVTANGIQGWEAKESRKNDIGEMEVAQTAVEMLRRSQQPAAVQTKTLPVILSPRCLGGEDGLFHILSEAFDGENILRKTSRLVGSKGQQLFSPDFSLIDDGTAEGGLYTSKADTEGVPSQRTVLVEKGVVRRFLTNQEMAVRLGELSSGNGFRTHRGLPKVKPTNLIVSPGSSSPEELMGKAGEGVLVSWLSGVHTANTFSGDFSVEAKNAFYFRNGRIEHPISSALIAGNIFDVLKEGTWGRDAETRGHLVTPSLLATLQVVG